MPLRAPIWTSPMPGRWPEKVCGGRSATCLWRTRSGKGESKPMKISPATAGIVIALGVSVAAYAQNTSLRAGAAKVDVTPAPNELPKNYDGILDHLYSRAIVLENGNASAALITVDAGAVPDAIWKGVSEQVEKTLGIPARNVL